MSPIWLLFDYEIRVQTRRNNAGTVRKDTDNRRLHSDRLSILRLRCVEGEDYGGNSAVLCSFHLIDMAAEHSIAAKLPAAGDTDRLCELGGDHVSGLCCLGVDSVLQFSGGSDQLGSVIARLCSQAGNRKC